MAEYNHAVDIANRALQHCGARRIDVTQGFNEDSQQASECAFAYGKLRRAELRRNVWRFSIRSTPLRPITSTTREMAPAMWSSVTTYTVGSLVSDAQGVLWISTRPANLNNDPGLVGYWALYSGPLAIPEFDEDEAYHAGDVVYTQAGDGTFKAYLSLEDANEDVPGTPNVWDDEVTYRKDALVIYSSVVYKSLYDFNTNQQPDVTPSAWSTSALPGTGSEKWAQLSVALIDLRMTYPRATGGRRIFRLPANFVRIAPQDPKAGAYTYVGGPGNRNYDDWNPEGNYFTSAYSAPIMFRFCADIQNVQEFDDMFCEGLAARLALAVAPQLTQSNADASAIAAQYTAFMSEARTVNGIETGSVEPPEDDFITARL